MNIRLVDVDGHSGFPNLALMKLSAWHKAQGDNVDWYQPLFDNPDRIYASKIFTFTPDAFFAAHHPDPIRGGTGYRLYQDLPDEIDSMLPDYSIYPEIKYAIGFLSRGCIRNCPWCVVPRKEGKLRKYEDVERLAQDRKWLILMDNNFLANDFDFVKEQLEKIQHNGYSIDFNQGLDARLMTPEIAALLAKCKWKGFNRKQGKGHPYIRFSCDTMSAIEPVTEAVKMCRKAGFKGEFSIYILAKEVDDTLVRIEKLLAADNKLNPMVMAYRNLDGDGEVENPQVKKLANWCNKIAERKACDWKDYKHKIKEQGK